MKTDEEWRLAPPFLTSALGGGELSAFTSLLLHTPGKQPRATTGTHWLGEWMRLRADLDDAKERRICPTLAVAVA
jgi:hypothetical protein